MPFDRLLEYLMQFKRLIPNASKIHLIGVEEGSTKPAFNVDYDYEDTFNSEVHRAASGKGTEIQSSAVVELNHYAFEDKHPVQLFNPQGAEIIVFPGAKRPDQDSDSSISGVKERMTIFAHPYKAGKKTPTSGRYQVWMTDLKSGLTVPKTFAPEDLGQQLWAHMERDAAVSGIADMIRSEDGKWSVEGFTITGLQEFSPKKPNETFDSISQIKHDWHEDLQDRISKHRGLE